MGSTNTLNVQDIQIKQYTALRNRIVAQLERNVRNVQDLEDQLKGIDTLIAKTKTEGELFTSTSATLLPDMTKAGKK